ncbi:cytochrome c biogenesis protein ResB [Paenibacillus chartarius]|uniref:Cytochrome c biogenesis protein ResB n=1 Tax=Paenibacillus chartarius TaxID=747481 RepID=A0ABV6DQH8_9BACL
MITNSKCECGHQNPVGTVLCESCGKPLEDVDSGELLEMRYDGVARRSQKENPSWIDKIWNFFSSVKIAIYLIVITFIGAALGTIYPQESTFLNLDPSVYYKETYGTLGDLYYKLGLSRTYSSWWFVGLLFMIGTSLVICSLDRVLPLYRALSKQQIRKHPRFLVRQKASYEGQLPEEAGDAAGWTAQFGSAARKKGYRVHMEEGGGALLAEKHRFSRWGPYINHIGLIIFLLGVLMLGIPGWSMDQHIGFVEGKPTRIPETDLWLLNEKFEVDFYKPEEMTEEFRARDRIIPKLYATNAVVYRCTANCDSANPQLEEVHRQRIEVNKPLNYKGLLAYQFDYRETPMILSLKPSLKNRQTGETYGSFELSTTNPSDSYQAGPYTLKVKGFYPDFALDEKGLPTTVSNDPKAPAYIFTITGPGLAAEGEPYLYLARQIDKAEYREQEINGRMGELFDISVGSMEDVKIAAYTSYLNIRVAKAMPFIWTGAAISMIGLVMGFYWQHRRIWLRIDGRKVTIGAHTNKNWYGLRSELASVLGKTGITVAQKALETGGDRS